MRKKIKKLEEEVKGAKKKKVSPGEMTVNLSWSIILLLSLALTATLSADAARTCRRIALAIVPFPSLDRACRS